MTLIEEAKNIRANRSGKYGSPTNNMTIFVKLLNAHFGTRFTPKDGAIIGIYMKLSREAHEHNKDNLLDVIGWADVANECEEFLAISKKK